MPKIVNCVAGTIVINPVTQTADVDVNSASIYEIVPFVLLIGNHNKNAPIKITAKNPNASICIVDNLIDFLLPSFILSYIILNPQFQKQIVAYLYNISSTLQFIMNTPQSNYSIIV